MYTYVTDQSLNTSLCWALTALSRLYCDESRGSEAKSQQRESDGWDSVMLQRLVETVSNQTQFNSNSNNPIVKSQMVREVQVDRQGSICV